MKANISLKENQKIFPEVRVASWIRGSGMFVPEKVVDNNHFASYLETSDEWIRERTGIVERRWAEEGVSASDLAEPACRQAIENAGLKTDDIDGIIVATVTPDSLFPSTACVLQRRLGVRTSLAFDVNAVCSGFVYALVTADGLITAGQCRNVLVVGVDVFSSIVNKNDRGTCVLFGDGAGAVVLSAAASEPAACGLSDPFVQGDGGALRGVYASELGADGNYGDILAVPNGTANRPNPESLAAGEHFLRMEGREVFKLAVRRLVDISERVLRRAGIEAEQVDYIATHQANKRIVVSMAKQLKVPLEKVLVNVDRFGNTSAASIPILLAEAESAGTIKPGDLVLLTAFGGGVTWGGALVRW